MKNLETGEEFEESYDKLILSLIDTAKRLVQDVGRMDEAALAVNEETTR